MYILNIDKIYFDLQNTVICNNISKDSYGYNSEKFVNDILEQSKEVFNMMLSKYHELINQELYETIVSMSDKIINIAELGTNSPRFVILLLTTFLITVKNYLNNEHENFINYEDYFYVIMDLVNTITKLHPKIWFDNTLPVNRPIDIFPDRTHIISNTVNSRYTFSYIELLNILNMKGIIIFQNSNL